jgi:hypothetical protein
VQELELPLRGSAEVAPDPCEVIGEKAGYLGEGEDKDQVDLASAGSDRGLREAAPNYTLSWHESWVPKRWSESVAQPATRDGKLSGQTPFLKTHKTIHSDNKEIARVLARSSCHADIRRVAYFPREVRVSWGVSLSGRFVTACC